MHCVNCLEGKLFTKYKVYEEKPQKNKWRPLHDTLSVEEVRLVAFGLRLGLTRSHQLREYNSTWGSGGKILKVYNNDWLLYIF